MCIVIGSWKSIVIGSWKSIVIGSWKSIVIGSWKSNVIGSEDGEWWLVHLDFQISILRLVSEVPTGLQAEREEVCT